MGHRKMSQNALFVIEEEKTTLSHEAILSSTDRRKPVDNPGDSKYWGICSLEIFFAKRGIGNQRYYGTGILISERHVLTAAHNLVTRKDRKNRHLGWCKRVIVSPAVGFDLRLGCSEAEENPFVHPGYLDDHKGQDDPDEFANQFDLAILKLQEPLGKYTGWLNVTYAKKETLYGY